MAIYNGSKIIVGLAIFVALIAFPIAYNFAFSEDAPYKQPELKLPPKDVAEKCVEDTEWMRENHMQLLNQWRDEALREGNRLYVSRDFHTTYLVSLQNGCMKCHSDKEQFCDKCHTDAAVSPYCWDCHLAPKEGTPASRPESFSPGHK